ncbi:zinc c2h2 type family protein, putative [Ichthyophthirius multifiliis]|uniref:Zinc c2h2 type family protein, putative n=1 Tax=Ichthyophthirius multifiliis TaxID=5932 RepID=G0QV91_ICHMU|nr:zinc c2h2 type family protein, putative [Ichthyophthirius multifiliis]EGR30875.1 zinc c2h2 type family protein, putative [Ichthyophthirius multifiliis]|eukprot:XP_004032462.1 zinc c2h2 type family protein, putative [Ichthyophthirius multifiliis]
MDSRINKHFQFLNILKYRKQKQKLLIFLQLYLLNFQVYPKYNQQTNYYQEFWKTYLMNEMMISKINELSTDNQVLDSKLNELEVILKLQYTKFVQHLKKEYQKLICMKNKKKNRRTSNEIEKSQICPYVECSKLYGSEVSLNLHIKLKHNGGNKTERERLAVIFFIYIYAFKYFNNLAFNMHGLRIRKINTILKFEFSSWIFTSIFFIISVLQIYFIQVFQRII